MLLGVSFDKLLIDVVADESESLLFEVAWCAVVSLAVYDGHSLLWGGGAPHLAEGVHVEGQVVELPVVVGYGRKREVVERGVFVHESPYILALGVEDMRPVHVYADTADVYAVGVASGVGSPVYNEALAASVGCEPCEGGAEESGADDEEIIGLVCKEVHRY